MWGGARRTIARACADTIAITRGWQPTRSTQEATFHVARSRRHHDGQRHAGIAAARFLSRHGHRRRTWHRRVCRCFLRSLADRQLLPPPVGRGRAQCRVRAAVAADQVDRRRARRQPIPAAGVRRHAARGQRARLARPLVRSRRDRPAGAGLRRRASRFGSRLPADRRALRRARRRRRHPCSGTQCGGSVHCGGARRGDVQRSLSGSVGMGRRRRPLIAVRERGDLCPRRRARGDRATPGDRRWLPAAAIAHASPAIRVRARNAAFLHARGPGPDRRRHSADEVDSRGDDRLVLAGNGVMALLRQPPLRIAARRRLDRNCLGAGTGDRSKRARR
jgi:hypothetical protein